MSAPGSTPLGPPGAPASRRDGTATPALPSASRDRFCLRCVKWLGVHPDHTCPQGPGRTKCDRCSTNGSPCHKSHRGITLRPPGAKPMLPPSPPSPPIAALLRPLTLRFQELLLARLDSLKSAYRAAHGQPATIPDDDETDDDGNDDGDAAGDGGGCGAADASAGGS
ncbi:MAG: hypothetical protein M1816_000394 [Peltula sp. TS41687]|nr:MAG: hypothetical protein M1816_000394 [Peltula sp. TS41687]